MALSFFDVVDKSMFFHQFLRKLKRSRQASRLELVLNVASERKLQTLNFVQAALVVFPVVFLGWAVSFFYFILEKNNANIQTMENDPDKIV